MRKGFVASALGTVGLLATVGTIGAVVMSDVRVSDPDPAAACPIAPAPNFKDFNYGDTELEPSIAVNPANPNILIGSWQQDRYSDGGARALGASTSTNGGQSWTAPIALPFDRCGAPNNSAASHYTRASDPWVSIGPDGAAYAISLSVNLDSNDNAVIAATSADNGLTWTNVNIIKADAGTTAIIPTLTRFFNDKESITADPGRLGVAYAVWDRIESPSATFEADFHAHAFHGPTWFSRTTDGGKTWSTAHIIFDPGTQNQTIDNVIVVAPNGTLYDFFDLIQTHDNAGNLRGNSVAFISSSDAGQTWSGPRVVASDLGIGVADPNNIDPRTGAPPAPLRVGQNVPIPAVDPRTGQLYVTWEDSRSSNGAIDEIVISTSVDGGQTWSAPKRVNTPTGQPAFTPTVAVADSGTNNVAGTVAVTYYQFQPTSSGSMPTNYFLKTFAGATVTSIDPHSLENLAAKDVTAASPTKGPFNMLDAPFARGYFTGDYEGLAAVGSSFVPFYSQTTCADLSCRALKFVTGTPDRTPTNNNSEDIFAGQGF